MIVNDENNRFSLTLYNTFFQEFNFLREMQIKTSKFCRFFRPNFQIKPKISLKPGELGTKRKLNCQICDTKML